ncbi:MAG: PEP-CTERM sorting domain-containing protein, partial [Sedimentisphaerales bacterium]|nr:PEP-CTERM sorting domain-containing protein [Sedimentisphaerales bacterium]
AIAPGETVSGFSVSFDWLGTGVPGAQFYEIIDPDDFSTLDSGYTVPEPGTTILLCLGGLMIHKRKIY